MFYFVAFITGISTVISMVQNSRLSQFTSLPQTTLLNFMTGLTGMIILFLIGGHSIASFSGLSDMHFFGYLGGLMGVSVVLLSSFVMQKISVIAASMLMYTGQMIAGFIIDYFRDVAMSPTKIIGCVLIILGVYIHSYIESRQAKIELSPEA